MVPTKFAAHGDGIFAIRAQLGPFRSTGQGITDRTATGVVRKSYMPEATLPELV